MAIDPEKLLALEFPDIRHDYDWRDCILYGLGLGAGIDPLDEGQLKYVDETKLVAAPTMANVLAYPGFWMRDLETGIDYLRVVHGEHETELHRPLPTRGSVIGRSRIVGLADKGAGKGALVYVERRIFDAESGEDYATIRQTVFCRGDGGFGGSPEPLRKPHPLPDRAPDRSVEMPTHPQIALIYRLSGDWNPLHSDPATARAAGFERPILHGLASFGIAGNALVGACCSGDPARHQRLAGRFSAPVFPGDTITIDIWDEGAGTAAYRARVATRDAVVINNGLFTFHEASA
ncbi:MaoC family dehydratase N-terminal domain-containing protein [Limibaculum sp. M0105]|uniref:MaoC family dehydratase N-terminal domain-containing protein n=1 Tax=Thermohalobaculum xanthum TaxID=2753746 RepID=A0A8J7M4L8_9RHOB|nr:MaoC/PaaZ C-terminal domain-containing protein [Thermohalobaculum xanthum]MBK0398204.1 MaoC family dehydratase N-terminal domain-containing protein [Thermohalobaculum xanthum]